MRSASSNAFTTVLVLLASACARDVAAPIPTTGARSPLEVERGSADVSALTTPVADPALAYGSQSGKPNHTSYGLYVMNSDGSNQTALVTTTSSVPHPS